MRLVELECRNDHVGTPILRESGGIIGAYCAECRIWIKWVSHSERWLALLKSQQYTRAGHTNPPDLSTAPTPPLPEFTVAMETVWREGLTQIAQFCYDQAGAMGFHDGLSRTLGERCMLVITELAELFEAYRKGTIDTMSDHIPDFTYREEEWADVMVRVFDHALDEVSAERLASAFLAKLAYNRTRGYRHGGKAV